MLAIEGLSIDFPGRSLICGLSMNLAPGEIVGLLGPSGAGKTTLGRAIAGLIDEIPDVSTKGSITLGNHRILGERSMPRAVRGRDVVLIPQSVQQSMPPHLTIGELAAALCGTQAAPQSLRLNLSHVGVADPQGILTLRPSELSGGERQRVLLAIALSRQPRVVVADEPTSSLDEENRRLVVEALRNAHRALGFTLVVISHDLHLVAQLTTRAFWFEADAVVERPITAGPRRPAGKLTTSPDHGEVVLEAKGIDAIAGQRHLLKGIDLRIHRGERLALLGHSGAGKTTLAKVLSGLLRPYRGHVHARIGGSWVPITRPVRAVQLIYQDPPASFDPRLSLMESLSLAGFGTTNPSRIQRHSLLDHAQQVSLDESVLLRLPQRISGGECQRAALVRAMLCVPSLVIADEVTSGLDPRAAMEVEKTLRDISTRIECALIIISHDIELVRSLCTRALVLDRERTVTVDIDSDSLQEIT